MPTTQAEIMEDIDRACWEEAMETGHANLAPLHYMAVVKSSRSSSPSKTKR